MKDDSNILQPDVEAGIAYWASQPPSYDGVLGGFGNGSLPRIDALGSRQFLLYLMPELSTVSSPIRPLASPHSIHGYRTRALDVGAGVGRVTADVLLHLVSDVVLVEPVDSLVNEAWARGKASETGILDVDAQARWKGILEENKSVTFVKDTLQDVNPSRPVNPAKLLGRVGYVPPTDAMESLFDIIWCQWCLGSLSDSDLIEFLRRSHYALRNPQKSLIVVKENCCPDTEDGRPSTTFDETDSSLTRWIFLFVFRLLCFNYS
ncbi:uncharacterized protein FIBRA_06805 [Fibroporia radiculosa]|uniref:Alpha N-terminal protein methyltransferase 1 n=1 Tax=Fibroporia radiculosa TaxID=599839 RepID=J4IBG5_9APHY|nr:uncharacterized protein FIBRA_06805 [Fibroporia radiculosa]CCM04621.1 predicted protein [Fibroporia radiculosa]